ncbi:hypothetical protein MLD38_008768 [Melastoma candidum]|uniref:Uncharacterized protein n=1 Tax=Melastoma candidum TaxID=119954 RepID=A0ACB9RWQ0_9MYRT|nr:hypothetical protein MLD38_008768 [Melastoma candidum]
MLYTTAANSWPRLKTKGAYTPSSWPWKLKRETVSEVTDPERVMEESEKFLALGFFGRVVHAQDANTRENAVPDSIRKDVYAHPPMAETLKSVGVDPKAA